MGVICTTFSVVKGTKLKTCNKCGNIRDSYKNYMDRKYYCVSCTVDRYITNKVVNKLY